MSNKILLSATVKQNKTLKCSKLKVAQNTKECQIAEIALKGEKGLIKVLEVWNSSTKSKKCSKKFPAPSAQVFTPQSKILNPSRAQYLFSVNSRDSGHLWDVVLCQE